MPIRSPSAAPSRRARLCLVLIAISLTVSACHLRKRLFAPQPRRTTKVVTKLENGLRVILQENHAAPVVALQMWVDVGSGDDPEDAAGLAHVLEHMVFKGTAQRGVGRIAQEIEGAGGDINAWTSFDQTVYHVVMASRFFDRGLDVLADTLQHPEMNGDELTKELQVVLEEIKEGEDTPSKVVSRDLFATAYGRHPYGRPVIGDARAVKRLDRRRVLEFFRRWYTPSNMTLVVVGDVDAQDALRRIGRAFVARGSRPRRATRVDPPPARRARIKVTALPTKEAHIGVAFLIPELEHPDTAALDAAAIILGQGGASRLSRRVRRELQLVSDIYCYAYTPRGKGLLIVGATTSPDKVAAAVRAISEEVFSFARLEVSTSELSRAQTIIESDAVYQKETVQGQARKLGFYQSVAGDLEFEDEYNRRVAALTPERLREAAARYLTPDNMRAAVVAPRAGAALSAKIEGAVARAAQRGGRAARTVRSDGRAVKVTLKNGARLIFLRDTSVPLLAVRAVWVGGLRFESGANNGVNNMLASLVTRGTALRSGDEIDAEIEGMAGSIGGFSGRNSFGLRAELLSRYWERGLEILADCILDPRFAEEELERQRREILEEIRARQDDPGVMAMRLFARTLYRRHPYRMDVLGSERTVGGLTRRRLVDYYRRNVAIGRMVLAVVGDIDPEQLAAKFEQLFGRAPASAADGAPPVAAEPSPSAERLSMEAVKKEQAHLVIGFSGATLAGRDRFALEVMASVLGGQGGRLFLRLRDREGLAYRITAFSMEGIEPGHFAAYVATSPEKVAQASASIEAELDRLRGTLVDAAELERVKRYLVGTHEISLQRRSTMASYLAFNEAYGLGHEAHLRYAREIMRVTPAAVRRAARRYLDPRRRVVTIVHPEQMSPGALAALGGEREAGVATTPSAPAKPAAKKRARKRGK